MQAAIGGLEAFQPCLTCPSRPTPPDHLCTRHDKVLWASVSLAPKTSCDGLSVLLFMQHFVSVSVGDGSGMLCLSRSPCCSHAQTTLFQYIWQVACGDRGPELSRSVSSGILH